ncbi:hypothetical protein Tco_0904311 [Tanacetum coccineum]
MTLFTTLACTEAVFPIYCRNDAVVPQDELQCKSQVSTPVNDEIDFRISFDESDDEDYTILFDKNSFSLKMISISMILNGLGKIMKIVHAYNFQSPESAISCFDDLDFFTDFENEFPVIVYNDAQTSKSDLTECLNFYTLVLSSIDFADMALPPPRIHRREVHRVSVFDFGRLPDLMAEGLSGRMLIEHRDEAGVWRMSWRQFILALGLHTEEERQTARFGVYWAESAKQILDKRDMRDYWMGISFVGDFLGTAPSYTLIRDPILRLCHRLIPCSIAGRSQAPEKVTVTDLFYLRGMDVDSVNIPYLLARYLRLFAAGRKSGAHISCGQFVARLAEHFGLLTAKIL